jgi:hypothetical protein
MFVLEVGETRHTMISAHQGHCEFCRSTFCSEQSVLKAGGEQYTIQCPSACAKCKVRVTWPRVFHNVMQRWSLCGDKSCSKRMWDAAHDPVPFIVMLITMFCMQSFLGMTVFAFKNFGKDMYYKHKIKKENKQLNNTTDALHGTGIPIQ